MITHIMEDLLRNPGLQHIIEKSLKLLSNENIASFRLSNQDCKNIVDCPGFYLTSPIHAAARKGHLEIVQLLMNSTTNPNVVDHMGWTPIHEAANNGHLKIVKLLMKVTDNPNAPDHFGFTPEYWAHLRGHHSIVKLFNLK